ncbi:MAG: hypothetical protein A2283_20495 [Lentisphaerae bacterium RIFOXYA12_FULL_48_11]|nr:MAG: hypothetical protein A2283_20495 [Lentisphaerae bacterium RIFOXYA12_FULL_48_11]
MMVDPILSSGISTSSYLPIVRNNSNANSQVAKSLGRLSSGLRIQTAADAPADLSESERLRSIISRYESAISNSDNAASYMSTADSYLQNISDTLGRMQELAVSANDGTKTDTDRAALQAEFEQLQGSITSTTSGSAPLASFNGSPIFQGDAKTIAIGPDSGQEMQLVAMDLTSTSTQPVGNDSQGAPIQWGTIISSDGSGISISSQSAAGAAVEQLGAAIDYLSSARAQIGAQYSSISSNTEGLRNAQMNSISRESSIRDLDYARETVNLVKFLNLGKINRGILAKTTGNLLATA